MACLGMAGKLAAQDPPQFTEIKSLTNLEMRLQLTAPTALNYRIEVSTNLLHWDPLLTLLSTGSNQHTDSAAPYLGSRIYRAFQLSGTNNLTGDQLVTDDGEVTFHPINHATLVMSWKGKMVYIDPVGAASIFQGIPRGGRRIYLSGDTEDIPEMRALQDIDVAFICMNVPFTMPADKAAGAIRDFRPRVVYPYHYRNQDLSFPNLNAFKQRVGTDLGIEVRLRKWY